MKILHYSLGLPPKRTGGMTKYCLDLIDSQSENNEVYIMFPGKYCLFNKKTKIKFRKKIGYNCYEIINPKLIPLCNGIKNVDSYLEEYEEVLFMDFFKNNNFDIVHIHTLMGLDSTFFEAIEKNNIKSIFTTHDYFGICPKTTLYLDGICSGKNFEYCEFCNKNALSKKEIVLMQSSLYSLVKNSLFVRAMRSFMRKKRQKNFSMKSKYISNIISQQEYARLQKYYLNFYNKIDAIHCNSWVSYNVYNDFIQKKNLFYYPISNSSIKDNRKRRKHHSIIKFLYLGPETTVKGFYKLIEILDVLYNEGLEFKLITHSRDKLFLEKKYIESYPAYLPSDLPLIFDDVDCLVFPSLWLETFGFTVFEALSYGVPVVISKNSGASSLIENNATGFIFKEYTELEKILKRIINHPIIIEELNENIVNKDYDFSFYNLIDVYQKILRGDLNEKIK